MRKNLVKQKLLSGTSVVNAWISLDSEYATEVLSHSGYDSITIDLQHGMFDLDTAIKLLRAASGGAAVPLARSTGNNSSEIGKLLDSGAYGIICPGIETAAEAEKFVASCKYPPAGIRSFGPARALLYGGSDYVSNANGEILAIAMIESAQALQNFDEIIKVQGLDGVYIGPNDLSFGLGLKPGGNTHPEILDIIQNLSEKAKMRGKFSGSFALDHNEAIAFKNIGVQLITPGNDVGMLKSSAQQILANLRGQSASL